MKKSFILHLDSLSILDEMTFEQKGILFDAIYKFQQGDDVNLDFGMKMAFAPFKNQFIRDNEKYNDFVEKQAENGKKGGRPPKDKPNLETQLNPNNPSLLSETQKSLNVSDNVSDSKKVSKNKKENNVFSPPTLKDVEGYFVEHGFRKDAGARAYNYYAVANWRDSKGNQVKNWKQKMQAVWFKDEHKTVTPTPPPQKVILPRDYYDEDTYLRDCKRHNVEPQDYYARN